MQIYQTRENSWRIPHLCDPPWFNHSKINDLKPRRYRYIVPLFIVRFRLLKRTWIFRQENSLKRFPNISITVFGWTANRIHGRKGTRPAMVRNFFFSAGNSQIFIQFSVRSRWSKGDGPSHPTRFLFDDLKIRQPNIPSEPFSSSKGKTHDGRNTAKIKRLLNYKQDFATYRRPKKRNRLVQPGYLLLQNKFHPE